MCISWAWLLWQQVGWRTVCFPTLFSALASSRRVASGIGVWECWVMLSHTDREAICIPCERRVSCSKYQIFSPPVNNYLPLIRGMLTPWFIWFPAVELQGHTKCTSSSARSSDSGQPLQFSSLFGRHIHGARWGQTDHQDTLLFRFTPHRRVTVSSHLVTF